MPPENLDTATIEFAHAVGRLVRRMRAVAGAQELSWTEAAVLKRLATSGPATTADLARAEHVTPQSMRTVVGTLEAMGLVARTPHPTDGRQVYIGLTAEGTAVRQSTTDARRTWLAQAIAQLDDRERDTLFAAGEIINRLTDQ